MSAVSTSVTPFIFLMTNREIVTAYDNKTLRKREGKQELWYDMLN